MNKNIRKRPKLAEEEYDKLMVLYSKDYTGNSKIFGMNRKPLKTRKVK